MLLNPKYSPLRPGVFEGVGGVGSRQLARLALLGRIVVHTIVLDLIPLLQDSMYCEC